MSLCRTDRQKGDGKRQKLTLLMIFKFEGLILSEFPQLIEKVKKGCSSEQDLRISGKPNCLSVGSETHNYREKYPWEFFWMKYVAIACNNSESEG